MATGDENTPGESRVPVLADLVDLCRRLNEQQARYLVVGGWAIIQLGFGRTTEDVDLLVEDSADNFDRIQKAMMGLPEGAVREMEATDLAQYTVVRVGDVYTVDLMAKACGVGYEEASSEIDLHNVEGERIPFANARLMWRLKQTIRVKDEIDRDYLRSIQAGEAG
jgi:hypothetical protein